MMGCSCDWERTRFTLDDMCVKAVRTTFFNLFKAGLIYRGKRLVNWDAHLRTAVADDEIFYEDVKGKLWTISYPVVGSTSGERLLVATTRPETLLGDTAVAVHPSDERYAHLIGKTVLLPLLDREIPIIGDTILVDPTFGTGCVKVTPAHDPNDYQTGLRHGLPMINLLNPDGTFNENAGPYQGIDRRKVRERVVADLEAKGLLVKADEYLVRLNFSDRSKTPIEPYLSDQWFVKMSNLAQDAMDAVTSGKIAFHPERYAKSYLDWLGEKRDWCISRQLWWGHRIPIWHCSGVNEKDLEQAFSGRQGVCWQQSESDPSAWLVCSETDLKGDELGPNVELVQDPDVLDTWFSSALWPHSTLGWPENTPELAGYYPTSVLSTARDIITLWVARMVIFGQFNMNEVPFKSVYIHPVIQDGFGKRMSKSAGNGIDPVDVIQLYGADALRFTLAASATETQDLKMPVQKAKLPDGTVVNTSERFELGRTFPNKLWNAARFSLINLEDFDPGGSTEPGQATLNFEDEWILGELNQAIQAATDHLEAFRFAELAKLLRDLTWNSFCDWYLELAKVRLRDSDPQRKAATQRVVASVLDTICRLLHPIIPFVTEEIWQHLNAVAPIRGLPTPTAAAKSVCIAPWPVAIVGLPINDGPERVGRLQEVVTTIRNLRSENQIPEHAFVDPIVIAEPLVLQKLRESDAMVRSMTRAKSFSLESPEGFQRPDEAVTRVLADMEVLIPLDGLIDRKAEHAKHEKTKIDLERQLSAIDAKLGNETFVGRAPADVVARERAKRDELAKRLEALSALIGKP